MVRSPASIALIAVLLSGSSLAHAQSLPQGGSVALGNAAIHGGGNAITVDQTSQRAVVNWDSFSVGQGAAVTFNQPNAGAAILNRVTGATASTIAGAVSGNGQMFLVNPNGIAITASGTVTMGGGFVASTLDISDRDFAQGTLGFNGSGTGTVSNSGAISVGSGGFAALLGGRVASSGIIAAPLGRIGLGSGRQATLDLTGDGFLQVALPAPASGDDPLVAMAGRLSGARIELRAATVSDAIRNAVNVPGELAAQGAHAEGGVVVLDGGAGGAVRLAGGVEASGATQGGAITLAGGDISLESGAKLTATGGSAGGTVLVGGGLQGEGTLTQATSVTMAAGSSIDVSATGDGHGGTAVLWSNVADAASQTRFAGTIRARGAGSGAGGMVETSGHRVDSAGGLVDAGAPLGAGGTWLIDPADSIIDQATANSYAASLNGGTDVLNSVTGGITWQSGVSLTKISGGNATLTLQAGNAAGNSPITLTGATITSTSNALNLVLWTRYNTTGREGTISITGSTITTNGGHVWMGAGASLAIMERADGGRQSGHRLYGRQAGDLSWHHQHQHRRGQHQPARAEQCQHRHHRHEEHRHLARHRHCADHHQRLHHGGGRCAEQILQRHGGDAGRTGGQRCGQCADHQRQRCDHPYRHRHGQRGRRHGATRRADAHRSCAGRPDHRAQHQRRHHPEWRGDLLEQQLRQWRHGGDQAGKRYRHRAGGGCIATRRHHPQRQQLAGRGGRQCQWADPFGRQRRRQHPYR
jgi:filamentous hemagglutinin family protein